LIYIETTGGPPQALQLVAGRIRRQVRLSDNVLLLENACALLLPATPFSGAQALASRLALLLVDIPYTLQVYHGMTALLVLQHLHANDVSILSHAKSLDKSTPATQPPQENKKKSVPANTLPYLA